MKVEMIVFFSFLMQNTDTNFLLWTWLVVNKPSPTLQFPGNLEILGEDLILYLAAPSSS